MKFKDDQLFDDTLELDLVFNTVPEVVKPSRIDDVPLEVQYPVLPVKKFTKEEIQALQDQLDARGNK